MKRKSEKHSPYFNLRDAFKQAHCPICYLARRSVTRFLDNFLYEKLTDSALREELRKTEGFCQRHFWQLVEFGDGFGISIAAKDVLSSVKSRWLKNTGKTGRKIGKKAECPACKIQHETERNYTDLFCENLSNHSLTSEYKVSFGLCLDHFRSAYKKIKTTAIAEELLRIETEKMAHLSKELEEFIRKKDYRFANEVYGKERDAWVRAVEFLKGRSDLLSRAV